MLIFAIINDKMVMKRYEGTLYSTTFHVFLFCLITVKVLLILQFFAHKATTLLAGQISRASG